MALHTRRLKQIQFAIGASNFECQVQSWNIANNTDDGEKLFSFCPDGEVREEADDDYALELTFYSDWRSAGVSEFLWQNDQQILNFTLNHHPDIPGEHVQWTGQCKVKAPNVGGEVRTTEMSEATLPIIGRPQFTRV